MYCWTCRFVSGLVGNARIPELRWRIGKAVCAVAILLGWGYYVTESWNPLGQSVRVWARCCGPKHLRTVRESETNMAMFHLSKAVLHKYTFNALNEGPRPPLSWRELIHDTGGYAGPHLPGTLTRAYRFLERPFDPWGRPWVFRIVQIGHRSDSVDVEFTYGSLGPDGLECEKKSRDYETARRMCDDLIKIQRLWHVPLSIIPEDIPVETRVPEVFTVPRVLWN